MWQLSFWGSYLDALLLNHYIQDLGRERAFKDPTTLGKFLQDTSHNEKSIGESQEQERKMGIPGKKRLKTPPGKEGPEFDFKAKILVLICAAPFPLCPSYPQMQEVRALQQCVGPSTLTRDYGAGCFTLYSLAPFNMSSLKGNLTQKPKSTEPCRATATST